MSEFKSQEEIKPDEVILSETPEEESSSISIAVVEKELIGAKKEDEDQFENITVFGNKSQKELHSIQSKESHLSAGTISLFSEHIVYIYIF